MVKGRKSEQLWIHGANNFSRIGSIYMETRKEYLKRLMNRKYENVYKEWNLPDWYEPSRDGRRFYEDLKRIKPRVGYNSMRLKSGAIFMEMNIRNLMYRKLNLNVATKVKPK